jgi:glycogen operon protein
MIEKKKALLQFTQRLIRLRREHPNLRRRKFFQDRGIRGERVHTAAGESTGKDISWLGADGLEMSDEQWSAGWINCIGLRLSGETLEDMSERGDPISDNTLLILFNPHWEGVKFCLPNSTNRQWELLLFTGRPEWQPGQFMLNPGQTVDLASRSVALLRLSGVEAPPPEPAPEEPKKRARAKRTK